MAKELDPRIYAMVLLGGDAGLRKGEMAALEFTDWNRQRGLLSVSKTEWYGQLVPTKGMEARSVPMTHRLREALTEIRHLRGKRVLYGDEGKPVTSRVHSSDGWRVCSAGLA